MPTVIMVRLGVGAGSVAGLLTDCRPAGAFPKAAELATHAGIGARTAVVVIGEGVHAAVAALGLAAGAGGLTLSE